MSNSDSITGGDFGAGVGVGRPTEGGAFAGIGAGKRSRSAGRLRDRIVRLWGTRQMAVHDLQRNSLAGLSTSIFA